MPKTGFSLFCFECVTSGEQSYAVCLVHKVVKLLYCVNKAVFKWDWNAVPVLFWTTGTPFWSF